MIYIIIVIISFLLIVLKLYKQSIIKDLENKQFKKQIELKKKYEKNKVNDINIVIDKLQNGKF